MPYASTNALMQATQSHATEPSEGATSAQKIEALGISHFDEDGWTIDDNDAEELDMETWVSQSPNLTQRCFVQRAENRETRTSLCSGPARMPTLVQQSSSHLSCVALVEHADDYADDEDEPLQEPQPQTGRSWRSRIPLPTRLVRSPQNRTYLAFITDDDMSDREPLLRASKSRKYRRTWRSWIPLPVKVSGQWIDGLA
ncbi:hypothetical protein PENFLA_c005G02549 [Penicillium flavigenum]|uniref:Uncharacterized protein n=1 Tax=Penicillium flavigenum TaxID=254877 RepID=A0A1V6TNZ8_9EURO|nr:hypothetical protein PENFLA_c005G02549 [Penicillium flavigenum]